MTRQFLSLSDKIQAERVCVQTKKVGFPVQARAKGEVWTADLLHYRAVPLCLFTTFTASLESLKREALKAFQCASTVKAVMENTGKEAGDGLLPCFALKSRFVQHDFSVR